jgi:hypothetical protein
MSWILFKNVEKTINIIHNYLTRKAEEFHIFCRMDLAEDWLMNWNYFMRVL